ncbi:unnamed protein product, partial [Phaeothamnion confervicola]
LTYNQVLLLHGDVALLSGVYTFAFLGVMSIFSVGCIVLKFKRPSLPREATVAYSTIVMALLCVLTTFFANVLGKPEILSWFALYFGVVGTVVLIVFQRIRLLKLLILLASHYCKSASNWKPPQQPADPQPRRNVSSAKKNPHYSSHDSPGAKLKAMKEHVNEIQDVPMIFFCKYDDLYVINKAILYVRENEQTQRLLVVHVTEDPESQLTKNLSKHIEMFDTIYPKIKISLLTVTGAFSPPLIEWLSRELSIAKNMMVS